MSSRKPFIKTGYLGLAVIAMSIILLFVFPSKAPSMPDGFITPIIAFEFIQTPDEVFEMFGREDTVIRNEMARAMDLGNRLDYIYMCLYTAFLLLFSAGSAKITKNAYYYVGAMLALAVLAADAMENIQLLEITANLSTGELLPFLSLLKIFTWIKWGGIVVIFVVLSPWFLKGSLFSKIIGIAGLVSFMLGVAASAHRSMLNEIFSLSVAVMFILMIIYCFTYKSGDHV